MLLSLPLPQHITIEILLKLPFESILSCELVSKQLKNLINNPMFYKLYHNKSVALQFGRDHLYLLLTRHVDDDITDQQFPPYTMHIIPMIGFNPNDHLRFLFYNLLSGSLSNSIACVKTPHNDYLLYNLFTGDSFTVEASPNQEKNRAPFWECYYGFGYDRYADDYNILEVYEKQESDMDIVPFWVYSFKNSRWKSFYGYPYGLYHMPNPQEAYSFNGVLHWVVVTMDQKRVALTYDLHTHRFGEILLPFSSIVERDKYGTKRVSELDGRLCYVYQTEEDLCVWVMQEYGVRESWTKLLAFDAKRTGYIGGRFENATPSVLCERRDGGKVVLFTHDLGNPRMFWYDIDKKEIKVVRETCYGHLVKQLEFHDSIMWSPFRLS